MCLNKESETEVLQESSTAQNVIKPWGIPRSFRLTNDRMNETARSMKEQCMKNEFFHTEFDPRLNSFIAQLFLKHIYSLDKPNRLSEEDTDGDLNVMDYLFKNLSKEELLDIERKINNERLYNKEPIAFLNKQHRTKSKKRRSLVDQDPMSNMNLFRMFKERVENGPNIYLPVDKKRRVFDAIEDGLSKYLPKERKK